MAVSEVEQMLECLKITKDAYYNYWLFGMNITIYVMAVIYLCTTAKKEYKCLGQYGIVTLLCLFFPIAIPVALKFWVSRSESWSLYYLLQTTIVLSYTIIEIISTYGRRKKKWIVSGIFVIIMLAALNYDVTLQQFKIAENAYHIDNNVIQLDQIIRDHKVEDQRMLVPKTVLEQICEYDGNLHLAGAIEQYSLSEGLKAEDSSYDILNKTFLQLKEQGITCIILKEEDNNEYVMNQYGYTLLDHTAEFFLYER